MGNCNAHTSQAKTQKEFNRKLAAVNGLPAVLKQKNDLAITNVTLSVDQEIDLSKIKYSRNEKEAQLILLKNSALQEVLAQNLLSLNVDLLEKLSHQDINLNCFVKCFKLETATNQSEDDLLIYFNNTKENLVAGFKTSIKDDKAKNLDNSFEFDKYKTNFQNDKAKVRSIIQIVSEFKDQMVFHVLINHTAIFSEMARKLEKEKKLDFFDEIKSAMSCLHSYYFDIIECKDKEKLEKIYHAYLNEEYNLFCLFHQYQTSVSQVCYTEFKATEFQPREIKDENEDVIR
jgi:hypothetical protein